MQVKDRTFLITGAASGLGAATAERLVNAGANVVLCDMSDRVLNLAEQLGAQAKACVADITSAADMQQAVNTAVALGGESGLSGVVHCAGVVSVAKLVDREGNPADLDSYARTVHINLVGTFNVMRLAAAAMANNPPGDSGERGVIINTASIAAFDGQVGQCAYSASKAGVVGMSLPAARELSRHAIRVMAIAPGVFETPMMSEIPDEAAQALAAAVPFPKRLGKPEEFALLAEQIITNPMLNGEVIRLDGGIRMQ
ncbi:MULTISPECIES: SDR family NAD(P)-dependent oxidoreductase [Halomonadaceae]|mgnify:FL=1|jgi:NAD(P)-dependent dehydrogenase (short-subunit alcohol dehydrogenase family)|uniref:3-hydroxyacyl-CoA dehydrogenase n=1 Tax=Vreelandella aquamarina TaxID=77097 RepID=A0A1H8N7H8_9GAMM|nr:MULTISPECIES: SDR family NAD(P)-dependent oxidoreductase [Halomonas]MBV65627.1 3-hydroxyacyl-CoA dehydrogenase [Halomonas sp.]MEC8901343.1 SDR family NAD(P)-dependent oxidoreductase [Pseudomonadota bacterium]MCD1652909.1 SDR family NAD(P)-dependent oxidoreductase [Halomonas axialensis]MCD2089204.1 SDR family NAD(P)-dependent oxidoreductase [Halomonas meridiana]MCP1304463.1 SDR family NAD(P)-dependent oxidoreductase [Halomonas sp. R1t8]|tara:strand:+ start:6986 stop:7753 length:768 start_codon:yes stop_codon:yes gene_type:complete